MAKEKKEIGLIITIAKEYVTPEEHKQRKTELFVFLLEQHRKLKKAS